jgi:multidrug efflux pump subunit AcrA (membrane-fusion protein)
MKRELVLGLSILCAAAAAAATEGCGKKKAPPPQAPPLVVVATVIQKDVPVYGEWIGTTAGDINAQIRPQITGYLLRRIYDEGSFVKPGQPLFEVDPRQIRAQLQQAEANRGQGRANLAKAERDVARFRPLAEQRAISQQELDNAVSAEQVARAAVVALQAAVDQARLNLSWTRVTSPIGGIAGVAPPRWATSSRHRACWPPSLASIPSACSSSSRSRNTCATARARAPRALERPESPSRAPPRGSAGWSWCSPTARSFPIPAA